MIQAEQVSVKHGSTTWLKPISFVVNKGMHLAIAGPSGVGKTTLLRVLAGHLQAQGKLHLHAGIRSVFVPQQHRFLNRSQTQDFYYQQRFNAADAGDALTVAEALPALFAQDAPSEIISWREVFSLDPLRHRNLLHLSNGENKRLQLAHALAQQFDLLLLDQPFIGLDTATRQMLEEALQQLGRAGKTIIISCAGHQVPSFIKQVLYIDEVKTAVYPAEVFREKHQQYSQVVMETPLLQQLLPAGVHQNFEYAVRMENVNVRYGNKQVLEQISWQVKKGERWSLSGPNGAGKSTLLSLITADSPQAYAQQLYLFDRKRGSGETIWEIKSEIGFVGPELHLYFDRGATVFETIASGFFDTIGLFRKINDQQAAKVVQWLQLLDMEGVANRLLNQLPLGRQRVVLLARALIKNPPLLVLDEPLQGLDQQQSALFRALVDTICATTDQTLIFVSHYTEDLPACIDHFLHLENGRVAATKKPHQE